MFSFLLGSVLPLSLPVGNQWIKKEANAAYSFKTTSKDMSKFAQELTKLYKCKEDTVYREMFEPQIEINSSNSWGLGLAIEVADGRTTYWHSGINPGMQCLFVMSPESNETIIIMTNSDDGLEFAKVIARDKLGIEGIWDIVR